MTVFISPAHIYIHAPSFYYAGIFLRCLGSAAKYAALYHVMEFMLATPMVFVSGPSRDIPMTVTAPFFRMGVATALSGLKQKLVLMGESEAAKVRGNAL